MNLVSAAPGEIALLGEDRVVNGAALRLVAEVVAGDEQQVAAVVEDHAVALRGAGNESPDGAHVKDEQLAVLQRIVNAPEDLFQIAQARHGVEHSTGGQNQVYRPGGRFQVTDVHLQEGGRLVDFPHCAAALGERLPIGSGFGKHLRAAVQPKDAHSLAGEQPGAHARAAAQVEHAPPRPVQ